MYLHLRVGETIIWYKIVKEYHSVQWRESLTSDSAPSEARERGSGGGSPRKNDDLLTGPSDLDVQTRQ
jgi:hypothetical protein